MRRRTVYRWLTLLCLGAAATALVLGAAALLLAHAFESAAAALCAATFFIPGLLFLRYWRRLYARDLALAHAGALAEAEGVTDSKALGEQLHVPAEDAAKILKTAIREGQVRGEMDEHGVFVASNAPRCPACGKAVPRRTSGRSCPFCGVSLTGG